MGSSRRRLAPSVLNSGCGAIATLIKASPAGPPCPGSPWPFSRICWPSVNPAGILTSTSLPVGSRMRFMAPLAASSSVIVSAAAISWPRWIASKSSAAVRRAPEPLGSPGEALEMAFASESTRSAASPRRFETVESRLALGIDLAAVECLALLLVAEQLVSGIELGELRRGRVLLVGVGMQLFRQAPEGSLDVLRTRRLLHPQDLIGVAHPTAPIS